jgi:N-acetylmuramoyl-L-alanine amidase
LWQGKGGGPNVTEKDFWLAIRRAAKTYLAALGGKGTATREEAGRDALTQVVRAIERRWNVPD